MPSWRSWDHWRELTRFVFDFPKADVADIISGSAGIPTIIRPFFGDQFFWADRVEALGVGTGVRKLTVDSMAEALIAATTDHKQIDRAKLVGEQIRSVSDPFFGQIHPLTPS